MALILAVANETSTDVSYTRISKLPLAKINLRNRYRSTSRRIQDRMRRLQITYWSIEPAAIEQC